MFISNAYAQAEAASASGMGMIAQFFPLILIFGIFYFLIIRPQQKQQKEKQNMINNLKRGDEVVSAGGIFGKVVELHDSFVILQIANNVNIKIERSQINNLVKE